MIHAMSTAVPTESAIDLPAPPSHEHPDFVDVDKIMTADGILIIISQRRDSGRLTFGIFRRYMKNDKWKRTSFIPEVLAGAVVTALELARKRMDEIRTKGKAAYPSLVMPVPPLD